MEDIVTGGQRECIFLRELQSLVKYEDVSSIKSDISQLEQLLQKKHDLVKIYKNNIGNKKEMLMVSSFINEQIKNLLLLN